MVALVIVMIYKGLDLGFEVAAPESSGTLHVDAAVLAPLAEQIFTAY